MSVLPVFQGVLAHCSRHWLRCLHVSAARSRKPTPEQLAITVEREQKRADDPPPVASNTDIRKRDKYRGIHSVEDSIKYIQSETFKKTYKGLPVWRWYRRNIKGQELHQSKPRISCLDRYGIYRTNNPCPICKDEYLVLDYKNAELLKMFMQPDTDAVLPLLTTGLCQEVYQHLQATIIKAKDYGVLLFNVPFRVYDYNVYYPWKDWGEMPRVPEYAEPLERSQRKSYIKFPVFIPDGVPPRWDWMQEWDKFAKKSYASY